MNMTECFVLALMASIFLPLAITLVWDSLEPIFTYFRKRKEDK